VSFHYVAVYKKSTGEIVHIGAFSCDEGSVDLNFSARVSQFGDEEYDFIEASADRTIHYVAVLDDQRIVIEKPPIPYSVDRTVVVSGGEDFITISGLHDPCEIVIDDPDPLVETVTETVTGGSFEFSAATVGVYTIEIEKFPFLPMSLEIIAVNPEALETASYSSDFSYEFGL
jgi:hypothetical protein